MSKEININMQRKNVKLSNKGWDVIESDLESFIIVKELSTLLNIIIENFSMNAKVSINNRIEEYRYNLSKMICDPISIDKLCDIEKNRLLEYVNEITKDNTSKRMKKNDKIGNEKFKLNVENYLKYDSPECSEVMDNYAGFSNLYFNALFEEYTKLSEPTRVEIVYRDLIGQIKKAIENKCCIKIDCENKMQKNIFIPVGMYEAYNHLYLTTTYLENNRVKNRLFRIEKISNIELLSNAKFETCDVKNLIDKIKDKGVFRACDEEFTYVVQLTQRGKELFRINSFNRPVLKTINDTYYYTVITSEYEFESYFRKFGKQVISKRGYNIRVNPISWSSLCSLNDIN